MSPKAKGGFVDPPEASPVWGKLQIKFPVKTKETEAIMVLLTYTYYKPDILVQKMTLSPQMPLSIQQH